VELALGFERFDVAFDPPEIVFELGQGGLRFLSLSSDLGELLGGFPLFAASRFAFALADRALLVEFHAALVGGRDALTLLREFVERAAAVRVEPAGFFLLAADLLTERFDRLLGLGDLGLQDRSLPGQPSASTNSPANVTNRSPAGAEPARRRAWASFSTIHVRPSRRAARAA
jgi:hypothetical protein